VSLTCAIDFRDDLATITPAGEVDLDSASLLRETVEAAIARQGIAWIDIDLNNVTFVDSTGIAVLVAMFKAAGEHGIALQVLRPHPMVRTLLEIVGLLDLLIARSAVPTQQVPGESTAELSPA
jgi:anti-sigma B factor antagonist